MPGPEVRAARPADAPALATLTTAAYLGQWVYTPAQALGWVSRDPFTLLAETKGEVVAALLASPFVTAPGGLRLQLVGAQTGYTPLYLAALPRAAALGYTRLLSVVREDHTPQTTWLGAAGWRNAYQSWGARLDLSTFDPARFAALDKRLYLDGTEVELISQDAPEAVWGALHGLYVQGLEDAPRNPATTHDSASLDYFRQQVAGGAVWAATRRGEVLAYTALTRQGTEVSTEHTATRRDWRRRGLATLVSAQALAAAQAGGAVQATIGGAVANLGMLRLNQRLGYRPEPMWLTWVRALPG